MSQSLDIHDNLFKTTKYSDQKKEKKEKKEFMMLPIKAIRGNAKFSIPASTKHINPFNSALAAFIANSVLGYNTPL